jgi:hypothetical protein
MAGAKIIAPKIKARNFWRNYYFRRCRCWERAGFDPVSGWCLRASIRTTIDRLAVVKQVAGFLRRAKVPRDLVATK